MSYVNHTVLVRSGKTLTRDIPRFCGNVNLWPRSIVITINLQPWHEGSVCVRIGYHLPTLYIHRPFSGLVDRDHTRFVFVTGGTFGSDWISLESLARLTLHGNPCPLPVRSNSVEQEKTPGENSSLNRRFGNPSKGELRMLITPNIEGFPSWTGCLSC